MSILPGSHLVAGTPIAERLGIPENERIVVRSRVRYIGPGLDQPANEPESLADSYYAYNLVKDTGIMEPDSVNTAQVLADLRCPMRDHVDELTPRIASRQETDRLNLAGVMAVLEVVRTTLTTSGKPVLVLHQIRPGNGSKSSTTWATAMPERPVLAARLAVKSDTERVIELRAESERWLAKRGIQQWTARWDEIGREKIRRNIANRETWVFEDDGEAIAAVTLNARPDLDFWDLDADGPALYLYKLLLARDRAGEGLGADIVNWSVDQAARRGFPWLRLDVCRTNKGLQRYYREQGFDHVRSVDVKGRDSGACFQRRAAPTPVENIIEWSAEADV
ncbi:hypothetical protein GCM10022224_026880 [Nonomuraea antimicrobica]|uniref:N-acetyltransferase domain-containing protein n=1 Tax=Nonomuraea antimicrobica TaxID=561173 RepID=A0ABP7BKC4_9ACTN